MTSNFVQLQEHFDDLQRTQEKSRAAALNGALKAFDKPRIDADRSAGATIRDPGAFSAATSAAGRFTPRSTDRVPSSADGNAAATKAFARHQQSQEHLPSRVDSPYKLHHDSRRSSAQSLTLPVSDDASRAKSPSNIAAVLAAQRFTPRDVAAPISANAPKSWHIDAQLLQQPRRVSPQRLDEDEQLPPSGAVSGVTDWLESIRRDSPMSHERELTRDQRLGISNTKLRTKAPDIHAIPIDHSVDEEIVRVAATSEIRSPKPVRVPSVSKKLRESSFDGSIYSSASGVHAQQSKTATDTSATIRRMSSVRESKIESPAETFTTPPLFPNDVLEVTSSATGLSGRKPTPPPPRRSGTLKVSKSTPAIGLGLVHAKSAETIRPLTPSRGSSRNTEHAWHHGHQSAALAAAAHPQPIRRVSPHMTGDSLANAIVASSLASSRAPSPTKPQAERPGMARRSTDRPRTPFSHFKQQLTGDSRTSTPGMYTMRKRTSFDEDAVSLQSPRVSRNIFGMRQHPNKHREGDRKRWRTELTEVERKRYEGVWAANRGVLGAHWPDADQLTPELLQGDVVNVVVRDIWSRSRLPAYILEEVWQLVDRRGVGRLDREEFCVGLWLIDRRLTGKKLPVKVGDSVWRSVHGVQGLRVPSYKKQ